MSGQRSASPADRAAGSTAVARVAPAGPPAPFRLARSLKAAEVGEVMALDDRGDVVDAGRSRLHGARVWLGAITVGGLGWAGVATVGGAAALGPAFFAGCVGLMAWEWRRLGELKQAIALAASGRRDEATAAFERLDRRRATPALRATIDYWIGSLAWQRGDLDGADRRLSSALATCQRSHEFDVLRWIVGFSHAQLLAVRGQLEAAVRLRVAMDAAPPGDYFRLVRMLTDLSIAFHRGSAEGLPEDPYDWAREALEMNRFGHGLVLLAWLYEVRGDRDMAAHLLREAPDRLEASFLPECDPALARWMWAKHAEWGLDLERDDV